MKRILYKTLLVCLFACMGQAVSADEVEDENTEEIEGTEDNEDEEDEGDTEDAGNTVEFGDSIFIYQITDAEKGEVTVVAGGCYYRYDEENDIDILISTEITIPSSVSYKGKDYSVTSIGVEAFNEDTELTSVTIPIVLIL